MSDIMRNNSGSSEFVLRRRTWDTPAFMMIIATWWSLGMYGKVQEVGNMEGLGYDFEQRVGDTILSVHLSMVATVESTRDSTTPWYPNDKSLDGNPY